MKFVCSKEDDGEVMFIEIIREDDEPQNEGPNKGEGTTTEGPVVEYLDTFLTRDELTYHNLQEGVVRFINKDDEVVYKMPYQIEQYNSLSNLDKEHTKSVYLMNEKDKRRGVEYIMSKILGFYKEWLELRPEYLTGVEDEGEVTKRIRLKRDKSEQKRTKPDKNRKQINLFLTPDDPMPPSIEDDEDSEGDILFLERLLHDDPIPLSDTLDFSYEVKTFLSFFTYPVTSPVLLSPGSENKIFDPGITINHFYS
uniref:Protein kinase-like domain, concanavalin A-like lectin/glucanase domain protein n=1 Tax=Tanacetum cinerariifolium TaxID=118510 RepID=A0A6L2LDJ1_TANCI|nr:protein kinase-like domain, concanavalin A-like lectin/glucanase domain protein [Tanacetum cinerariifolium]